MLLEFWASWCGPCIGSMPYVKTIYAHYKGKPFSLIGMNVDDKEESAKAAMKKYNVTYPNLKGKDLFKEYKMMGIPHFFLIDKAGVIRAIDRGMPFNGDKHYIKRIDALLKEKP